jgi:hypothetical protein
MDILNTLSNMKLRRLDPSRGVLVCTTYWRPQPEAADPEQPGEKASVLSYLPVKTKEDCPCGSGHLFETYCQPLPYWQPLCPNPGMQGYSLFASQSATFSTIPRDQVYAFLQEDIRLYCVQDTRQRAFWVYWGDPALDAPPFGTLCFGDFELTKNTLVVSTLSDIRMNTLLDLIHPLNLGTPLFHRDPLPTPEKPVRKRALFPRKRQTPS